MTVIAPIQQLVSAQRIAKVQQQSNQIAKNLTVASALAGTLSSGDNLKVIDSLLPNNVLIGNLDDHLIVAGYLLIKYSGSKQKVRLNCKQVKLAIVEVKAEIVLIEFQKDPKLIPQLEWTKNLLHKLEHKYNKCCKKHCKKC